MSRVLILDDEESLRQVLCDVFEEAGYEVIPADGGESGVRLFLEEPTELVITDLIMPGKEGIETIRELRHHSVDVKIIAISGRGGPYVKANLDRALAVGADCAIPKPFTPTDILDAASELLSGKDESSPEEDEDFGYE